MAAVVLHQLLDNQELNHNKLIQVGVNGDIMAVLVEIVTGLAAAVAALLVVEVLLLLTIVVEMEVLEEDSLKFLQHLVIVVFSVAVAVVAVMLLQVTMELVDLVVVDKVVVMKARTL